jgi:hypothetical protein
MMRVGRALDVEVEGDGMIYIMGFMSLLEDDF